jgi:hypothetical protein
MEAVEGQGDGQREQPGLSKQGPEEEPPIVRALDATSSFWVKLVTLGSTSRFSLLEGNMTATVNMTNGSAPAFLRANLSAYMKLQNVSGNSA